MTFEAIDEEGLKREPFWKAHGYKKGGSSMDECAFICLSTSNQNNHLYPCLYKFSCRAHLRTNQQEYLTSKTYVLWMSSMDEWPWIEIFVKNYAKTHEVLYMINEVCKGKLILWEILRSNSTQLSLFSLCILHQVRMQHDTPSCPRWHGPANQLS